MSVFVGQSCESYGGSLFESDENVHYHQSGARMNGMGSLSVTQIETCGTDAARPREDWLHSTDKSTCFPWFALQVRTRYERNVASYLEGKGFEWFLPTYQSRRKWSDRMKDVTLSLFPGYLFCRFDPQHRLPILKTPGMISIVGTAKVPTAVDEAEIEALRHLVESGLPRQPWPYLQAGQRVRIEYGSLCGLEGILLRHKGQDRLVLSVTLLQRSTAVEIDGSWVTPIQTRTATRPAVSLR